MCIIRILDAHIKHSMFKKSQKLQSALHAAVLTLFVNCSKKEDKFKRLRMNGRTTKA